jgi:hypothetical protein
MPTSLRELAGLLDPRTKSSVARDLARSELRQSSILSSGTGLALFRVNAKSELSSVVSVMNSVGFKVASKDFKIRVDKHVARAFNALSLEALAAARSYVPVRSHTLRNEIKLTPQKFTSGTATFSLSRDVYVTNAPHTPPYAKGKERKVVASSLADVLNEGLYIRAFTSGFYKRRRNSEIEVGVYGSLYKGRPAGSLTQNWVLDAQRDFSRNKSKIIKTVLS